jgi:hypothetical protein
MKYDIIIFSSKEYLKNVSIIYDSIIKNILDIPNKIYCITPIIPSDKIEGITYISDNDIYNYTLPKFKPDWIKQQYIKLLQTITLDDYLVIDGDLLINKPISIFENNKINLFVSFIGDYKSFNRYNKNMFDLVKDTRYSFINDIMIFNRNIINEMILSKFKSIEDFIVQSNQNIDTGNILSEYELFGTFITKNYSEKYNIKFVTKEIHGFHINDIRLSNSTLIPLLS